MAYEKQTWASRDVVTSAKLNHIEDGIAAAAFVQDVTIEQQDGEDVTEDWMTGKKAYKYNGTFPQGFMAVWGGETPSDYAVGSRAGGDTIDTAMGEQLSIYEETADTVTIITPSTSYQKLTVTQLDDKTVGVINTMILLAVPIG